MYISSVLIVWHAWVKLVLADDLSSVRTVIGWHAWARVILTDDVHKLCSYWLACLSQGGADWWYKPCSYLYRGDVSSCSFWLAHLRNNGAGWWSVLRIQALLIRIWIPLFTLIRIWIFLFSFIQIQPYDTDLDPYYFKKVMYLKQYFLYIFTWFSSSVGSTGPTQKVFFVKCSLPVNFVVPLE